MNQSKSHLLRRLFRELPNFNPEDPRWKNSRRHFKRAYLAIPRPKRAAYLTSLKRQIEVLKTGEPVAESV